MTSKSLENSLNYEELIEILCEYIESSKLKIEERVDCMSLISFLLVNLCSSNEKKCDFLMAAFSKSKGAVFEKLCKLFSKGNENEIDEYIKTIIHEKGEIIQKRSKLAKEIKTGKLETKGLRN